MNQSKPASPVPQRIWAQVKRLNDTQCEVAVWAFGPSKKHKCDEYLSLTEHQQLLAEAVKEARARGMEEAYQDMMRSSTRKLFEQALELKEEANKKTIEFYLERDYTDSDIEKIFKDAAEFTNNENQKLMKARSAEDKD